MRTLAGLLMITNCNEGALASEHLVELVDELGVPVMDPPAESEPRGGLTPSSVFLACCVAKEPLGLERLQHMKGDLHSLSEPLEETRPSRRGLPRLTTRR